VGDPSVPVILHASVPITSRWWLLGVLPMVAGGAWLYVRGTRSIWAQLGQRVIGRLQLAAWLAALAALAVAVAPPLDRLAGELFSVHMLQHLLLTLVAAPLLALAAPGLPLLRGLPDGLRRRATRVHARAGRLRRMTRHAAWPVGVVLVHLLVVWTWHLPAAYEAALRRPDVHALEHASLLATAALVWWTVLACARRAAFGHGTAIAVLAATGLGHGALGALLTFAPVPLYQAYVATAAARGTAPLADQQLAGTFMWLPAKAVHAAAIAVLAVLWIAAVERRSRRGAEIVP
jgi:putative membrane protein